MRPKPHSFVFKSLAAVINRTDGVFRRAINQVVRVSHVNKGFALSINNPNDMQFLEEERAFLVENIVLLFQFLRKGNGASLAASDTSIRSIRSDAETARDATSLCVGQEARYASYIRVIESIDLNAIVSTNQTEAGADTTDIFSHGKRAECKHENNRENANHWFFPLTKVVRWVWSVFYFKIRC